MQLRVTTCVLISFVLTLFFLSAVPAYANIPSIMDDAKLVLAMRTGATIDVNGIVQNSNGSASLESGMATWQESLSNYMDSTSTYSGIEGDMFNGLLIRVAITSNGTIYVGSISSSPKDHLVVFSKLRSRHNYTDFENLLPQADYGTPKNRKTVLDIKQNMLAYVAGFVYETNYEDGYITSTIDTHAELYECEHTLINRFPDKISVLYSMISNQQADYSWYNPLNAPINDAENALWSPIANDKDQSLTLSRSFDLSYSQKTGSYIELGASTDNQNWSRTTANGIISAPDYSASGGSSRSWRIIYDSEAQTYISQNYYSASSRLGLANQYPTSIEMTGRSQWSSFGPYVLIAAFGDVTPTGMTESPSPGDDNNPSPFKLEIEPTEPGKSVVHMEAIISLLLNDITADSESAPEEEAYINNSNNTILGQPGELAWGTIAIPQVSTDYTFTFSLAPSAPNPDGLTVSADGEISYVVPAGTTEGSEIVFTVQARNDQTGNIVTIEGTIYVPELETIAEASIPATGDTIISDIWNEIAVEIPADSKNGTSDIEILRGYDEEGNPFFQFETSNPDAISGDISIHLPDIATLDTKVKSKSSAQTKQKGDSDYAINELWDSEQAYFAGLEGRIPDGVITGDQTFLNDFMVLTKDAWALYGSVAKENVALQPGEPVLFVHGFMAAGFGGGESTWKNLPEYIKTLNIGERSFLPFEFKWRTNSRFQDAANGLERAINIIATETGKDVHIVAHSFGGLLSRTMLQKLNSGSYVDTDLVASITTLGSPHSGIADDEKDMHGTRFPGGQDSNAHEFGLQISCHQAGESIHPTERYIKTVQINSEPGYVAKLLADTDSKPLPEGLPVQVCIGLSTNMGDNEIVDDGDGLISFQGQRFHPKDAIEGEALRKGHEGFGGILTERILNMDDDVKPGEPSTNVGYKHSNSATVWPLSEPAEPYATSKTHHGYLAVKEWLSMYQSATVSVDTFNINLQVVDVSGNPISGAAVKMRIGHSLLVDAGDVTDAEGKAIVEVPFYTSTTYRPIVSKTGYKTEIFDKGYTSLPNTMEPSVELGVITLQDETPTEDCQLQITIRDARSGTVLQGVTAQLTKNGIWVGSGTSNTAGVVSFSNLVQGTYAVKMIKSGYITSTSNDISVVPTDNSTGLSMVPEGDDQTTIRLTWGANPADLDSHLVKFNSNGVADYHLYYVNKTDTATNDNLDLDDITSYGPETTTIQDVDNTAKYVFGVHHYSGSGSISSSSSAQVVVSFANGTQRTFYAPTSGTGNLWKVFEIVNGEIIQCSDDCLIDTDNSSGDDWAKAKPGQTEEWLDIMTKDLPNKFSPQN